MEKNAKIGKISQVVRPVVDVEFPSPAEAPADAKTLADKSGGQRKKNLPNIYSALEVNLKDGKKLVLETHQHLGGNKVRAVAMGSTDGLRRQMEVIDTGAPISVPVGPETLGRMFNLLGEPVDGRPKVK